MSRRNEKKKAEMKNDIRKTVKKDRLKVNVKKRKIINFILTISIIAVLALVAKIIISNTKVSVKDEDVIQYNYFLLEENGQNGIIDKTGKIILKPQYDYIQIPNPSQPIFICFYDYQSDTNTYKTKVINDKAETLYGEYNNVKAISRNNTTRQYLYQNNVLTYEDNQKYGLITIDGKKIINAEFDSIETLEYKDGLLEISKNGKKRYYKIKW